MKTNILVQYQGGGYNGCVWEWNYFYIDKQGTFHNIQSSGSPGIDNAEDAEYLIHHNADSTYIYNLDNEQDIELFSNESHPIHVTGVLQWFDDYNSPDVEFFAVCSVCGNHTDINDTMIDGDKLFCYECYSLGQCPCCEYYVGAENIVGRCNPDEHYGHDYLCTDCKENHDNEREQQILEDLRWQAFCTGKPDIFSEALREWWL